MLNSLLQLSLELITTPTCGVCREPVVPLKAAGQVCPACEARLQLPPHGLQGTEPLPFWSLGWYDSELRRLLLGQRQRPERAVLAALARHLRPQLSITSSPPLLVAIPSWKRKGNPLPGLITQLLGFDSALLLMRTRPTLGQHHLNRTLRALNQEEGFRCRPGATHPNRELRRRPVLLVDDILTTGATALAAATALKAAHYRVEGLICLARTPRKARRERP